MQRTQVATERQTAPGRPHPANRERADPRRTHELRATLGETLFRAIHREVARAIG